MPTRAGRLLILIALALPMAVLYFGGPISDIDFWWHINHGRWIREHAAIPGSDPFGVYADINHWGATILRGQWAGQLLLFLAFDHGGALGVISLRFALMAGALAALWWRMTQANLGLAARLLALAMVAVVLAGFSADRPQLFSLLMFSLLVLVLELAAHRRALQWLILPLLVLWTNLHQAVLLGAVTACVALLILAWEERRDGRPFHDRLAAALGALAAVFVTPNGFRGLEYLVWLEFEPTKQRISEYGSPFSHIDKLIQIPHLIAYFAFAAALAVLIFRRARQQPAACILPAALLVASLGTYRYIPFVMIMAAPWLAAGVDRDMARSLARTLAILALTLATLLASGLMLYRSYLGFGQTIAANAFPIALVQGRTQEISGRVFTSVSWGGYLGWMLEGRATPFIDGRYLLDTRQLDDYTHILWASPRGQALFDQYRFDWVIIPLRNQFAAAGPPYPLISLLGTRPDWELIASNPQGVVFVRRRP